MDIGGPAEDYPPGNGRTAKVPATRGGAGLAVLETESFGTWGAELSQPVITGRHTSNGGELGTVTVTVPGGIMGDTDMTDVTPMTANYTTRGYSGVEGTAIGAGGTPDL